MAPTQYDLIVSGPVHGASATTIALCGGHRQFHDLGSAAKSDALIEPRASAQRWLLHCAIRVASTQKNRAALGANGGEVMICFFANQPRQYQIRPHLDTGTIIRQLHANRHCRNRLYEGPEVIMHRAPRLGIARVGLLNRTKQFDPRRSMRTDTTDRIHGSTAPERLSGHMASVSCCKW